MKNPLETLSEPLIGCVQHDCAKCHATANALEDAHGRNAVLREWLKEADLADKRLTEECDQLRADLENERRKVTELVDGYEKDQAELKRLRTTIFTDNTQTVVNAEREIQRYKVTTETLSAWGSKMEKRIAELEAELERLKAQEPVGIVDKVGPFGFHVEFSKTLELGTKLYLASGAAQKETDRG